MFLDRTDAGARLAKVLLDYRVKPRALVLGLPRGGVIVASEVSRHLDLPLDVFVSRKLKAPWDPQFALGAVTESGNVYLNYDCAEMMESLPANVLSDEIQYQKKQALRLAKLFRGGPIPSMSGKNVLIVDDGVATGSTLIAAIQALRVLGPLSIAAAIPFAPMPVVASLGKYVDDLAVLEVPRHFESLAFHYRNFNSVEDREVLEQLALHRRHAPAESRV